MEVEQEHNQLLLTQVILLEPLHCNFEKHISKSD